MKKAPDSLSFEEALEALNALSEELENSDLPLNEAIAAFEKSQALFQQCKSQLDQAEHKVQALMRQQTASGLEYALTDFEVDDDLNDD